MPLWHGTPLYRQAPWQPQPLRKPVGVGSAGPQTYPVTVSTTQAQTLAVVQQARLTRSMTQAQTLSLVKRAVLARGLAQTQSLVLTQRAVLTRAVSQAQTLAIVAQKVYLRTVTATQAQTLALVKRAFLPRSVSQAQTLSVRQALTRALSLAQAVGVALVRQPRLPRSLTQAQTATVSALHLGTIYPITRSAAVSTTVSLSVHAGVRAYDLAGTVVVHQSLRLTYRVIRPPVPALVPAEAVPVPSYHHAVHAPRPSFMPQARPGPPPLKGF